MGRKEDAIEGTVRMIDESSTDMVGFSMFNMLTMAAILSSAGLFASGHKNEAIWVGLLPPTFQALKLMADKR
jgi:hypothetical protein